jgi:hypothetical protein
MTFKTHRFSNRREVRKAILTQARHMPVSPLFPTFRELLAQIREAARQAIKETQEI